MAILAVEPAFSSDIVAERYWGRGPVLFHSVAPAPFEAAEVFRAAVRGSRPAPGPARRPGRFDRAGRVLATDPRQAAQAAGRSVSDDGAPQSWM